MVTVCSPDGQTILQLDLRAPGGCPVVRVRLGARVLLGWSALHPAAGDPPARGWRTGRMRERVLSAGPRAAPLAREKRVELLARERPARRFCVSLRCADGAASFRMEGPGNASTGVSFRWPRGAEVFRFGDAQQEWTRQAVTELSDPCELPLTGLYPHGACGALLGSGGPGCEPVVLVPEGRGVLRGQGRGGADACWWVVLSGDRPCALPAAALAARLLTDAEPELPVPAEVVGSPASVTSATGLRAARHNCLLPFLRAPGWPAAWSDTSGQPRGEGVTPVHRLALEVILGKGAPASGPAAAWDETCWLRGEPGEYVLVARRVGAAWWLAAINGERARTWTLRLPFLLPGRAYAARLWRDGGEGLPEESIVDAAAAPVVELAAAGGLLLALRPIAPEGG